MNQVEFQTTHKLPFLSKRWDNPFNIDDWQEFKIGTCKGQWMPTQNTYDILGIVNYSPGNGHFTDVIEWFENSCKRDNKDLRIMEVMNKDFALHLVSKKGFTYQTDVDLIKRFTKQKQYTT